jgi:hypothetical protein
MLAKMNHRQFSRNGFTPKQSAEEIRNIIEFHVDYAPDFKIADSWPAEY